VESGWVVFASMLLVLVGSFQAVIGLMALFGADYYLVGPRGLLLNVSYEAWGLLHLLLGAIAAAAAYGLTRGKTWARVTAIVLALLSAIVNLGFMRAYPGWSMTVIALGVLVIYAATVHGER